MAARILVVDDDQPILRLVHAVLTAQGYVVTCTSDGQQALREFGGVQPAAVLLDIVMPGLDGWAVLQALRERDAQVPVLLMSASSLGLTAREARERGADDFIAKPFAPSDLVVRVEALLAPQARAPHAAGQATLGCLSVDLARRRLHQEGREVKLHATEWALLEALLRGDGAPVSAERLLEQVWGVEMAGERSYLELWIRRLRQRLQALTQQPFVVETPEGYLLVASPGS